jgi:hypothetical protein
LLATRSMSASVPPPSGSTQALSTIVTVDPDSALAYSASFSSSGLPV